MSIYVCLQACRLLSDDYEQVRSAAVQMVWVLSQLYPERWEDADIQFMLQFIILIVFVMLIADILIWLASYLNAVEAINKGYFTF